MNTVKKIFRVENPNSKRGPFHTNFKTASLMYETTNKVCHPAWISCIIEDYKTIMIERDDMINYRAGVTKPCELFHWFKALPELVENHGFQVIMLECDKEKVIELDGKQCMFHYEYVTKKLELIIPR